MTDWLKVAIDFVTLLISLCAMGYAWFRTRDAAADRKIAALRKEVEAFRQALVVEREERNRVIENERTRRSDTNGQLKDRITAVEEKMKHLPTIEHHGELHRDLNKLEGRVETVVSTTTALTESMRRVEDYLMKPAGGGKESS